MVHRAVLTKEVIALLDPCRAPHQTVQGRGGILVDATVGSGGHSEALLDHVQRSCPDTTFQLIAIDRDKTLLTKAKQRLSQLGAVELHYKNFADLKEILSGRQIDGLLADLGFSSEQVDDPARGFSFRQAGPLDMRYDQSQELTAAEIINHWHQAKLRAVIERYSGERYADRIAHAIVRRRPLYTTTQLAEVIAKAVPTAKKTIHPATRTFQALRIVVNHELESLEQLLDTIPTVAKPASRIVIITFHSLEERLVRDAFKTWRKDGKGEIITKKPLPPTQEEIRANPRSRSAHLWAFKF